MGPVLTLAHGGAWHQREESVALTNSPLRATTPLRLRYYNTLMFPCLVLAQQAGEREKEEPPFNNYESKPLNNIQLKRRYL